MRKVDHGYTSWREVEQYMEAKRVMADTPQGPGADASRSAEAATESAAPDLVFTLPPFWLNQSRWKTYKDCDRLYGWFYNENLSPGRPRKVLEIGSAVHKAMMEAHMHGASEDSFIKATRAAEASFREAMGPIKLPGDEVEVQDGVSTIKRLLPAYFLHWRGRGELWRPLAQEVSFDVEVGEGSGVRLRGKIDNLATLRDSLWLVDYKTMGRLDMRDFQKYELDIQLTVYIYGGSKQLSIESMAKGGKPVLIRGAIIDGLVKTEVPQFHREMFQRTVEELRAFEQEFCQHAYEMAIKHALAAGNEAHARAYFERMLANGLNRWKVAFPKNTQQCFRYGTCPFLDLCIKDTPARRTLYIARKQDYVDEARAKGLAK